MSEVPGTPFERTEPEVILQEEEEKEDGTDDTGADEEVKSESE